MKSNSAIRSQFEHDMEWEQPYPSLSFTQDELDRAGKIFDRIKDLPSPNKERELVRLVLGCEKQLAA